MPKLKVFKDDSMHEISFTCGSSVRDIIGAAGISIRSGCLGNGACGLCLIEIVAGRAEGLTQSEQLMLSQQQAAGNMRLACQTVPGNDIAVRIVNADSRSHWHSLPADRQPFAAGDADAVADEPPQSGMGLAVDLGTTHISATLWELAGRRRLQGRFGLNPQHRFGADVMTRLTAAGGSADAAESMARMPLAAISRALFDMCAVEGISPAHVNHVAIVGNTPMLSLLTRTDPGIMLDPRFWTEPVECVSDELEAWVTDLGIASDAAIDVVEPFAGFVGSDLMAGVLNTGLTRRPNRLLIDFGTNAEIALWDGKTLWVTSAACGPAFESSGIQCGVPAEPGAIYRFRRQGEGSGATDIGYDVLGGGQAAGICGSGLVDLIACLRESGELSLTGSFTGAVNGRGYLVQDGRPAIRLTKGDVDMFQRAKAAIAVGVRTLLARAGMRSEALEMIYICGAFGRHLDKGNAQLIGLLPRLDPGRIEICGNTALAGCEELLLSPSRRRELAALRGRARILNMAHTEDFEQLFFENLFLQPLELELG
ncbi:MAG: ASKHA domain-containing protein [Thermoleophilia bacterium]